MLSNYEAYEHQVEIGDLAKPLSLSSGSGDVDPFLSESSLEEALIIKTKQHQPAPASTSKPKARAPIVSKNLKPSPQILPPTINIGAISVPSCSTCAVRGEAAKRTVKCDVCLLQWHRVCVKHLVSEEYDLDGTASHFCCPQCVYPVHGRWDQLM